MSQVSKSQEKPWIRWAFLAAFCFAGIALIMRHLSDRHISAAVVVGGMFGSAAVLAFPFYRKSRSVNGKAIGLAVLIGILAYGSNILQVWSIQVAPNPGLPPAVIGTQVLVVTLIATVLFRSPLSPRKMLGLALSLIGVACMGL